MTNFAELARKGRTDALARLGHGSQTKRGRTADVTFTSVRGGR